MNAIQEELNMAKEYMLKEISFGDKTLVELSQENVAKVEAMICNDSAYINSTNKEAGPGFRSKSYQGSSAFWMTMLKKLLIDKCNVEYTYDEIIRSAVEAVDRENSTHLNADNRGRDDITERLLAFDKEELIKCLKDPDYGDMKLFNEIARKTSAKVRARLNPSFASKFCHYACFNLFEGTEYQDNYSIYDSILKSVLPLYLDYFGINKKYNLNDYKQYREAVDAVREASGNKISRNGFDHLLWYYHKGRI